jgi:hypothetical protein
MIQFNIVVFNEIEFHKEPIVGTFILKIIGFAAIRIIGFDPALVEFGDITINMQHLRFCTQSAIRLKTRIKSDGW